jgi:hypothetical protein
MTTFWLYYGFAEAEVRIKGEFDCFIEKFGEEHHIEYQCD